MLQAGRGSSSNVKADHCEGLPHLSSTGCGQSACSVWVRLSVYTIDEVMGFATSLICMTAADEENHRQNRKGKEKRLKL